MMKSVQLRPAEVLLFEIMMREDAQARAEADAILKQRTAALFLSHELPLSTEGHFQKDPLDGSVVRFLYDDGVPASG